MVIPSDITGVDAKVARRLIAVARTIAPCIGTLVGEAKEDAVAILQGVVEELPKPGDRRVKSMSRNGTSVTLAEIRSAFTEDDRAALRGLCSRSAVAAAAAPVGSFPPSGIVGQLWPEGAP